MAIPDGKPATDFSAMNREWVRSVAKEEAAAGGGGLPEITEADEGNVLTVENSEAKWVTPETPEESKFFYVEIEDNMDYETDPTWERRTVLTAQELVDKQEAGMVLVVTPISYINCGDSGDNTYMFVIDEINVDPANDIINVTHTTFDPVAISDAETKHFCLTSDSIISSWTIALTPDE